MRLTIVNLLISGQMEGGTERSAGILARKPDKLNPPYAGCRIAADATYEVGVAETRQLSMLGFECAATPPPRPSPASGRGRFCIPAFLSVWSPTACFLLGLRLPAT